MGMGQSEFYLTSVGCGHSLRAHYRIAEAFRATVQEKAGRKAPLGHFGSKKKLIRLSSFVLKRCGRRQDSGSRAPDNVRKLQQKQTTISHILWMDEFRQKEADRNEEDF
jgi:hypothetical protein